jgi:hypothetical protein
VKSFAFYSFCSHNENPKKDAATAPFVEATAADEPSFQEAAPVVKSPEAPLKKGNPRASKCLKKAAAISTSLDAHQPMTSADDVSTSPCSLFFYLLGFFCSCLPFIDFDEEVRLVGH